MQRAERRLALIQKKIKNYRLEENLQRVEFLNKLCDTTIKKRKKGIIICGLVALTLIILLTKYHTSEVSDRIKQILYLM